MDVTIVVPAYNEEGRIGPTVRELVQEYSVLVIDDGSNVPDRKLATPEQQSFASRSPAA